MALLILGGENQKKWEASKAPSVQRDTIACGSGVSCSYGSLLICLR